MKCNEVRARLEDYFAQEPESRPRLELETHLDACPACRSELELLEQESRYYAAYGSAIETCLAPRPETWDRICARIEAKQPSPAKEWWGIRGRLAQWHAFSRAQRVGVALAGVLVLAIAARIVLFRASDIPSTTHRSGAGDSSQSSPDAATATASAPSGRSQVDSFQAVLFAIQQAERDYLQAIEMLSPTADRRKAMLDPQLKGAIERDMKTVDRNLTDTRKAYKSRPQDVDLARFMLSLYAAKLELLQAITS